MFNSRCERGKSLKLNIRKRSCQRSVPVRYGKYRRFPQLQVQVQLQVHVQVQVQVQLQLGTFTVTIIVTALKLSGRYLLSFYYTGGLGLETLLS
jgi:hypothetical protein